MENHQETGNEATHRNAEANTPDYVAKTYRTVMQESGMKTRKDRIGVAWKNSTDGSIAIKTNGVQIIDDYVYLFPYDNDPS